MNVIKVNVNFKNKTINKSAYNLTVGDYNSTKIIFTFDREDGIKIFEMNNPNGELLLVQEIENNEIVLNGKDENGQLCSLFAEKGRYDFEVSLYSGESKLTSASSYFGVKNENVKTIDNFATGTQLPIFEQLIANINNKTEEVNNLDINCEKEGNQTTVTLTKKDGTTKTIQILDGEVGPQGPQGIQGIEGKEGKQGEKGEPFTYQDFTPEQLEQLRGPEGKKGDTYVLQESDKQEIIDDITSNANSVFNQNVEEKTGEFNTNAQNKNDEFNANADDLRQEIEYLKANQIPGSATGSYINVKDSSLSKLKKLSADGVCEQITTIGKNMLNSNRSSYNKNGIVVTNNGDGTFTANGTATTAADLPLVMDDELPKIILESGKTYTQSLEILSGTFGGSVVPSFKKENGEKIYNYFKSTTDNKISIKTSTEKLTCYTYNVYVFEGAVMNNCTFRVQLEEGSEATSFESYTGGQPSPSPDYPQPISVIEGNLQVTSCNKNVWKVDKIEIGAINENGIFVSNNTRARAYYKKVNNCNILTISSGVAGLSVVPYFYDEDKKFISYNDGWKTMPYTFNIENNVKYVAFLFKNLTNTINLNELTQIQLEKGDIATPFEQHLETQLTINLPEGEFAGKINDTYKDTFEARYNEEDEKYHLILNKKIGKSLLNEADFSLYSYNSSTGIYNYRLLLDDAKLGGGYTADSMCTHFTRVVWSNSWNTYETYSNPEGNALYFYTKTWTTLNDFKTWLLENNVKLYYKLAEPYTLDLGVIDMPLSYRTVTNVSTDSELNPNIEIEYYKDLETVINNLTSAVLTLGGDIQ